jgi:predicted house-cleaning noncanonical NTP pyrophosphatase (MazG superfamily)
MLWRVLMAKYLVKVIRDKMGGLDRSLVYDFVPQDEVKEDLRKKLVEEALEYILDPSLEELADVYEVVLALLDWDLKKTFADLKYVATAKTNALGGFTTGLGMYVQRDDRYVEEEAVK